MRSLATGKYEISGYYVASVSNIINTIRYYIVPVFCCVCSHRKCLLFIAIQAVAETIVESGRVDPERVAVIGGSHGGFLSAHLIGQFPVSYTLCI